MTAVAVNVDFGGASVAGQSIKIYDHGTQNLSSIFDRDGVIPLANPVTSTGNGHVLFAVAPGTYDLVGVDRTHTITVTDPTVGPIRGTTLTSPGGSVFTLSVDDTGHLITTLVP